MQVYLRTSEGGLWGLTSSQRIKDIYVTDRLNQLIHGFGKQMAAGNFTSSISFVKDCPVSYYMNLQLCNHV